MYVIIRLSVVLFFLSVFALNAEENEADRVESSISVLKEIQSIPEKTIPNVLLQKAYGIAIIPNVIKGAVGVGGRWGKGIMVVKTDNGTWSPPSFITLGGGSIGFQFGGQSTDFVLVFRTKQSVDGIASGKLTIGADASATAGPVGRNAQLNTDAQLKSEIVSYAMSRGLFAGVSIEGTSLSIDDDANAEFYNRKNIKAKTIFEGQVTDEPPLVKDLKKTLVNMSRKTQKKTDTSDKISD
jgi:lipid-binding SYLF domain-containing protein